MISNTINTIHTESTMKFTQYNFLLKTVKIIIVITVIIIIIVTIIITIIIIIITIILLPHYSIIIYF